MGVTKTDFMRGMQCPRMLWFDKHHPELKIIPPYIRDRLNKGNEFGDSMMGAFGPYEEVKEYYWDESKPPGDLILHYLYDRPEERKF